MSSVSYMDKLNVDLWDDHVWLNELMAINGLYRPISLEQLKILISGYLTEVFNEGYATPIDMHFNPINTSHNELIDEVKEIIRHASSFEELDNKMDLFWLQGTPKAHARAEAVMDSPEWGEFRRQHDNWESFEGPLHSQLESELARFTL